MLTSNVGWGQAVQGGLSCPPPRISERMDKQQSLLHHLLQKYLDNLQILLHYLLQEYLVERDKKMLFQSIWDAYFKGSVGLRIDKGWGGKLSRTVYLAPHPEFQWEPIIRKFYYTIYYRNI